MMITFMKWYFPFRLLLTIVFLFTKWYNGSFGMVFVFFDFIAIPLVVTIVNLVSRKKKLRAGEYRIKPEGRRL